VYLRQEKMIFQPDHLPRSFTFNFQGEFRELYYEVAPNILLHAILFKIENPKGLLLYFHGNAGSLSSWGQWAAVFQKEGFDVLMYDYRGYGKSGGKIRNESSIHSDAEFIYHRIIQKYEGKRIVFYGRSLGTGIATKLAAKYTPEQLILTTPYFNFKEVVRFHYPYLPADTILKYRFRTDKYIVEVKCPVELFHGTQDELVPYENSLKLAKLGNHIHLTTLEGGMHGDLNSFPEFRRRLKELLD
jgi:alpha-beta hydrolase superfamily lysophospholipase